MANREGKSFETWWESVKDKPSAEKYLKYIEEFLAWKGWGYEELFTKFFEARRSNDPRDQALVNNYLVAFFNEVRRKGFSKGYARNKVGAVIGFLAANGLPVILTRQQSKEIAKKTTHIKDNFTREEVALLVSSTTSPRNKAIIMILKDTGMAASDVCDLNIQDIKKALDNEDKFIQVSYERNKTQEHGEPVLGYESLEGIKNWLRWREQHSFKCTPESPLFILTESYNYSDEELKQGIRLRGGDVTALVKYIVKRAGLTDKRVSAHCLRIFNASQLESAGVNKNIVYRLQGRLIPDSGRVYSKGEVLSSYIKAYDNLVIGPKPQIIEVADEDIEELRRKNEELTEKLSQAKKEQDERIRQLEKYQERYGMISLQIDDTHKIREEFEALKKQLEEKLKKPKKRKQKKKVEIKSD